MTVDFGGGAGAGGVGSGGGGGASGHSLEPRNSYAMLSQAMSHAVNHEFRKLFFFHRFQFAPIYLYLYLYKYNVTCFKLYLFSSNINLPHFTLFLNVPCQFNFSFYNLLSIYSDTNNVYLKGTK